MAARNYVRIYGNIFNADKVLHVGVRNSHLYWKHPYILELQYAKQWTETDYVNVGHKVSYSIPVNTHHESMWFKYKYGNRREAEKQLEDLKQQCSNTTWRNRIDKK